MKNLRFNLLYKLLTLVALVLTSITYSQTPSLTLTTSLGADNITCANTAFTLTVSDTTLSLNTTYTLSYGSFVSSLNTTTGSATFSLAGVSTETVISLTAENPNGSVVSNTTIYVPRLGASGTISTAAPLTICYGGIITNAIYGDGTIGTSSATLAAGSSAALVTYQWQFKTTSDPYVNIPGASTGSTLSTNTLSTFQIYENITIRRVSYAVSGTVSCSVGLTYPEISIIVSNVLDPIITSNTIDYNVCTDQSYNFSTAAVGGTTHYWYIGATQVATGDSFNMAAGTISTDSTLGLIAFNGTCSSTLVTETLKVAPLPSLTITTGLDGDVLCPSDSFTLTVQDTQSSNTTYTLTYGSQQAIKNSTTGIATFTISGIVSETTFRVEAEPATGCSGTATKTVLMPIMDNGGTVTTTFTTSLCSGDIINDAIYGDGTIGSSSATLSADSSAATISYTWEISTTSDPAWTPIGGATGANLATNTLGNIYQNTTIRRAAYARIGTVNCNVVYSNEIPFTVDPVIDPTIIGSLSICSDLPNQYSIGSAQGGYTYHWFIGGVNQGTGSTYTVAAGAILGNTTIGLQGVTSAGCSTTLVTSTITLATPLTLSLDTDLTGDILCPSDSFTLTVSDTQSSNTTYTLTYGSQQAIKNSTTGIATFTISGIVSETTFRVEAEPATGCSGTATKTVLMPIMDNGGTVTTTFTTSLCSGDIINDAIYGDGTIGSSSATLSADSSAATISYTWEISTTSDPAWTPIGGATGANLATNTLGNIYQNTTIRRAAYARIGTVNCNVVYSNEIPFTVDPVIDPTIIGSLSICSDLPNQYSIGSAQGGYTYHWFIGGVNQGTGSTYTVAAGAILGNTTIGLQGVTSAGCSTTLVTSTITLATPLTLSLDTDLTGDILCPSDSFTLTVSDTQSSNTTYTLTYGSQQAIKNSTTGIATFTISGIVSETTFRVEAEPATGCSGTATKTVLMPIMDNGGTVTTTFTTSLCSGDIINDAIYGDGTIGSSSATLSADSSAATISYTWEISTTSDPAWTPIGGATGANLATNTLGNIYQNTTIRRAAYARIGTVNCNVVYSNEIPFTVDPVIDPTIIGSLSICSDLPNQYSIGSAQGGYTYHWFIGGVNQGTGSTYTVAAGAILGNTTIGLQGVTSAGCSTTLVTSTITLATPLTLSLDTDLTGDILCPSDSFTLTVSDTQSSNTTYTLTYGSQQAIKNSTTGIATFTISGIVSETTFRVEAEPATGCSGTATKTVLMPIMDNGGTVTTTFTTSLCSGDIINDAIYGDGTIGSSSATLSADSSAATISYTWEISTTSDPAWTPIGGATGANLATNTLGNIYQNTTIRRAAYARIGTVNCNVVYSNEIPFTVDPVIDPTIIGSLSICSDLPNQYSIGSAQGGYTYHWFIGGVNQGTGSTYTVAAGAILGNTTIGLQGVTSAGCSTTLVTSTITLATPLTLSLDTDLTGDILCPSDSFTLTVSDTQSSNTTYTLTYGSQQAIKNSTTGIATFTISGIVSETTFRVEAEPATGCSGTATKTVLMPIMDNGGTVTTTFTTSLCSGDIINDAIYGDGTIGSSSATLSADSSAATISYTWEISTTSDPAWTPIGGATGANLATNTLGNIYQNTTIRRAAYARIGTVNCNVVYSNEIPFTVDPVIDPTIIGSLSICSDLPNQYSIGSAQGGYTYHWFIGGVNQGTGSTYTVAAGAILGNTTIGLQGVTSAGCSTTLVTSTITLATPLTLSLDTDLTGDILCPSDSFTLTVSDTQSSNTTYTLTYGSQQAIKNSTTGIATFTISGIVSETTFRVEAEPATGCSGTATKTVLMPIMDNGGTVTTTFTTSLCSGDIINDAIYGDGTIGSSSATLSADSSAATISYTWEISTTSDPAWTPIGGATGANLATNTLGNIYQNTTIRRAAYARIGTVNCNVVYSNEIPFTVDPVIDPTIIGSLSICSDLPNQYSIGSAQGGYTYHWFIGGVNQGTGSTYTVAAGAILGNTTIGLQGVTSAGCSTTLVTSTITLATPLTLSLDTDLTGDILCPSDSFTLTVSDTQSSNTTYTLTYGSQQAIKNSTTGIATFTISGIVSETTFRVEAEPATGCSGTATKTVLMPIMDNGGTVTTTFTTSLCSGDIINDAIYGDGTIGSSSATLSADSSAATISYTWEISTTSDPAWTPIGGATGANLATNTLGNIYQNTTIRRAAYARIGTVNCNVVYSNEIPFTVDPVIDPTIIGSLSICSDLPNQYSIGSAQGGYTYHWFIGGVNQGTGSTYTVAAGAILGNTTIGLQGVTSAGCSTTLVTSTITLATPLTLSLDTDLTGDILCPSDSFTLTVSDTQSSNTTYTLTYGSQQAIKNSTTGIATFTISGIVSETTFRVEAEPATGCSGTATKTVLMPIMDNGGTVTTTFTTSLCSGDIINDAIYGDGTIGSSSATLSADSSAATISYTWEISTTSDPAWTPIGGATGANLATNTLGNIYQNTTIRRAAYARIGTVNCNVVYSNEIPFTVDPVIDPTIIGSLSICSDLPNQYSIGSAQGGYTYHWFIGGVNQGTGSTYTVAAGAILGNTTIGLQGVTSAGCSTTLVTSTITLATPLTLSLDTDLTGDILCPSDSFTLTVSDTQSSNTTYTLTYGSQQAIKNSTTGIATFTISGIVSETTFRVEAEPATGCSGTATKTVLMPIMDNGGTVTTTFTTSLCSGDIINDAIYGDGTIGSSSATLSADSSAATISYIWEISTTSDPAWTPIGGATGANLATNTLGNIYQNTTIRRAAYARIGTVNCNVVYSNEIPFTVDPVIDPTIIGSLSICSDLPNQYSIGSAQGGYTYHWFIGGVNQGTGSTYTVAAGAILGNTTIGLQGVTSAGCSTTLVTSTITLATPLTLSLDTDLTGDILCPSDSFTLTVSDTQSSNTTYTLTYGSQQAIKNSTTGIATFTISGIVSETTFRVEAEPATGCSGTATKTVLMPIMDNGGTVTTTFTTSLCSGDIINDAIYGDGTIGSSSATLSADSSAATISYTWEISTTSDPAWTPIGGATGANLATNTLGNIYQNTTIRRAAYARIGTVNCNVVYSNEIPFTVDPVIDPTIIGSLSICSDLPNQYSIGSAQGGYTYHWFIGGVNQGTGSTYTVAAGAILGNTTIGLQGVTSAGCSTTLVTSTITLATPLTLSLDTDLTGDILCPSDSFTLTVSDTQSSNTTYTLTYGSQQAIKNSTTGIATFTISGIVTGTTFRVTATPATGCSGTATRTVSVPQLSTVGSITTAFSTSLCYGDIINDAIYGDGTSSSASATLVTGSLGSVSYQWQVKTGSNPTWRDIIGATGANLATNTLGAIYESTNIRRVPYSKIGTVTCTMNTPPAYPEIIFTVQNLDGGTISPATIYSCDISGVSYTISVSDNSFGSITYQWQSSTTNTSSASFSNISGETNASIIVSTNVTQTTYYRRIVTSAFGGSTCTPEYSNVFELLLNSVNPGTIDDVSGLYCEGSVPPVLGLSSTVTSTFPITYQWYKAETDDLSAVTSASWSAIPSANNNSYVTPALSSTSRYILYKRGVIEDRGAAASCEKYTNEIAFEIYETIDIGYVEPATGTPDFPYCVGDQFPNLRLISYDPNIIDNSNYQFTIATWEYSTDGVTWQVANEIINDNREETFSLRAQDSNNPSDTYYLADDMYFRVKIHERDAATSSISSYTLAGRSIKLIENSATHDIGDNYKITIGSSSVSVTVTNVNSTTALIGAALASSIDSDIANYSASYIPGSKIIQIEDIASNDFNISASTSYTLNKTLEMNVLQAFNNNAPTDGCVYYTSAYKIDVVDRPTISVDGGSSSQEVCDGSAITPIPITWTGSSSILIIDLDSGLSVNVGAGAETTVAGNKLITGTDSITITGTPNSGHRFTVRLNSYCRDDSDLSVEYRIDKISNPPVISNLFRDAAWNWEETIYENGGKGYNNTICVDSSVAPSNTASLTVSDIYACFANGSSSYGGYLDWEFVDRDSVNLLVSPTLSNTSLNDPTNSKETGTRITWNPSFLATSTVSNGAWITIRVRTSSTCSATVFSNFFEKDVWLVKTNTLSQTNTSPDLPTLTKPTALNVTHFCSGVGGAYDTRDIPTCEVQSARVVGDTYTQFFSAADTGTNDFGSLEWELSDPNAGSINANGVVLWTPGFYGNVKVRVRPISCSNGNVSSSDWVESDIISISPVNELIPNITRTNIPTCPIPATGSLSTTLESDIPVDWYIKTTTTNVATNSYIKVGTVTFTGAKYESTDYYQIETNTGTGGLLLPWANSASGTIYLKAVPQGCTGTEPEWIRDLSIRIPDNPKMLIASNNIGTINPEICENETDFVDIVYDVIGRSVTGITVSETTNQVSGSILNAVIVPKSQVATITFNEDFNRTITRFIIININDNDYKIEAAVDESSDSVATKLANLIDADSNLTANYNSTTNKLVITGSPGYYFTIYTSDSSSDIDLTVNFDVDSQVYSQVEIRGVTGYIPPGIYMFRVDLTLDSGCEQDGQVLINLTVNDDAELTLTSGGTTPNQDVCYNEAIDNIVWAISGLDNLSTINVSGALPSNIISDQTTTTFTMSSNGTNTDYWNTRVFPYTIISDGDLCDEATQSGAITVYPKDYLRRDPTDLTTSQVICEGSAMTPINYEFWGVSTISATIQDLNGLGLSTSVTTTTQIASITFDSLLGVTSTNTTEYYSIYINDEIYTVTASTTSSYTATNVLSLLSSAISSTIVTSTLIGNDLVITGLTSGTTFALEGRESNGSNFSFNEQIMVRAPRILTISGTPTLSSLTTLTTRGTYDFNIVTVGGQYCSGTASSSLLTYTLFIDPVARLSITSPKRNLEVCDGYSNEFIRFETTGGAPAIEISASASPSSQFTFYPSFGAGTTIASSIYEWYPNIKTNVTTITTFTYTATATANACGASTSSTLTVTGTVVVYPHYINKIVLSGDLNQTLFQGQLLSSIDFNYSSEYSDATITWPNSDNLNLSLTSSGSTLSLSGNVSPTTNTTTTTSHPYIITIESKTNLSPNCSPLTVTGTIILEPEYKLTLTSSATSLDQEISSGSSITPVEIVLENGPYSYKIEWKDNTGTTLSSAPLNLTLTPFPDFANVTSLTLSGTLLLPAGTVTPSALYYRISTVSDTSNGGISTIDGRILGIPEEKITSSVASITTICQSDNVNLEFSFAGIQNLSFTSSPSLPLGLSAVTLYTTTPTFEIDVVSSSTQINEVFQIEILQEDGSSQIFSYKTTSSTTTSSTIAANLGSAINHGGLNTSVSGSKINLEAISNDFVFRVKENQPYIPDSFVSVFNSKLRINETIPVTGSLTVTGTILTKFIGTNTYSLTLETPGISGSTATTTIQLVVNPNHFITNTTTTTLNQTLCDNNNLGKVEFELTGGATDYAIVWSNGIPAGTSVTTSNTGSSVSLTISGTLNTGVTTTTTYPYEISTVGNNCNPSASISGTIVVEPNHYIAFNASSGTANQTVCDLSTIDPIIFDVSGGATGIDITWTPSNPGYNIVQSSSSSTSFIISNTLNTNITSDTTYTYLVTTNGNSCDTLTASLTGQITVLAQLKIIVDTPASQDQIGSEAHCDGDAIDNILFSFTSGAKTDLIITWYDSSGNIIGTPGPILDEVNNRITGTINSSSVTLTTYNYTLTAVDNNNPSCVFTDSFSGSIQVAPSPIIDANYILNNDVIHVSCNGGSDGSIIIPITPTSEFEKRIVGGQIAGSQIDQISLLASATLNAGDVLGITIDSTTISATVGIGRTATSTIMTDFAEKINLALNNVTASLVTSGTDTLINLTADNAGTAFISSSPVLSSSVTGTVLVSTTTPNQPLNYSYSWKYNGVAYSNDLSIENLSAGTYELSVSVNGCSSTSATITIEEPTTTIGTASFTCDGNISLPVTTYFTPTQMAIAAPKIKGTLYKLAVDGTYTTTVTTQEFVAATATSTFVFNFNGINLDEGEKYKVDIYDLFCNTVNSIIVGPVDQAIAINEGQITVVDEDCINAGGTITIPNTAITGGSGSFAYNWTNTSDGTVYNTRDIVGASDGVYTLTITDAIRNCSYTLTNPVTVLPAGNTVALTWASATNITVNQCADGRLGRLELVPPTGGSTDGYSYEWEFTPATSSGTISNTIQIVNNSFLLIPSSASEIPSSMSTTGQYKVRVYEGPTAENCPIGELSISITGPTPVSLTSSLTFSNILCSGDNNGTIEFTVTGGIAPYFYSLNGGAPSTPLSSGANTHLETGLAPGQYNVVIKDSTPDVCTPVTVGQTVTITEPTGGPLELTEGSITEIPCNNGGIGSFEVNISGGSNQKVSSGTVSSGSASFTTNNIYQVRVVGPAGNFTLNTSIDSSSETSILIENISAAGDYEVTVTDGSGFCSQNITITMPLAAAENLAASAQAFDGGGCNSVSDEGGYIQITQFSKGDGEISGYPLWQRLTSGEFDKFNISLAGTMDSSTDLNTIGVVIGGVDTINASGASSSATLAEVKAQLTDNINALPNYTATLNGSSISVVGQIIDSVTEIGSASSTINISVSSISKITQSSWSNIPGVEGQEKIENLQSGTYRGIIKDGSGCGSALVQNVDGGTTFRINDPKTLEIKDFNLVKATCNNPDSSIEFRLSNGAFILSPDENTYDLTLNSVALLNNGPVGTAYSINPTKSLYKIDNLIVNDYELTVFDKTTSCTTNISFSVDELVSINYSGETEFVIDPCFETFQEDFFDPLLIEGGTPFINLNGDSYYSLTWRYYPQDTSLGVTSINSLSNSVNFNPGPGRYELYVKDSNGCKITDSNGVEVPIDFTFSKELGTLAINGTGGASGDEFSQPVSCEINSEDGKINIEVVSGDPNNPEVGPYNLNWHVQAEDNQTFEQRLLIEGTSAGDSLEVYTIRLNEIAFSYITQVQNEPKESVKNELINIIDQSPQFSATENSSNPFEIILKTESLAALELEIVSKSTKLRLIKTTSNNALWIPLDGTSGYPDYTGFLDLNNLAEGLYRYTITSANVDVCTNNTQPNSIQGTIVVENENILEIREGPIVDEYLCNGQPGTIFIDIFDGDTGPLTFRYNGSPVTFERVGTNQYIINIDNPVEIASLEIYNSANCGLSREINIGNGTPLFDFNSTNFLQSGSYLAREDITFSDISENEYESFEFIFGDGTQTELIERNSPEPIVHEYAISGTYYVTLRIYNDLGCVEELTKTIKIGKGYSLLMPNVFTPNGDIWNNTFRPVFNGFKDITLRIYDAQGGLLYEEIGADGSDPDITGLSLVGWDGDTNTQSPYYIFTITATTLDDEPVFRDGTFILLK